MVYRTQRRCPRQVVTLQKNTFFGFEMAICEDLGTHTAHVILIAYDCYVSRNGVYHPLAGYVALLS